MADVIPVSADAQMHPQPADEGAPAVHRHVRGAVDDVDVDTSAAAAVDGAGTSSAEYDAFLRDQETRVRAEEAALLAAAEAALEGKRKDELYARALTWLDGVLASAQTLNARMSALVHRYTERFHAYTREQPAALNGGTLRDYQMAGFKWLVEKYLLGESVIVADEMGLGKTVQVISLLAWMSDNAQDFPVLVVAPLSTVGNWIDELARFAPSLPTLRYRGSAEERETLRDTHIPRAAYAYGNLRYEELQAEKQAQSPAPAESPAPASSRKRSASKGKQSARTTSPAAASPGPASDAPATSSAATRPGFSMPVFVTNLETVLRDAEVLSRVRWRLVVVDEGHKLKKEQGAIRRALSMFHAHVDGTTPMMKILLTGTPVQNDIMELWSLCNFVMPLIFKDKREFAEVYRFIALGTEVGAAFVEEQERTNHIISKLHELLSRYMLRRTKNEVHLSLPPKVEALVYTPLSMEQVRMLKALENGGLVEELKRMQWRPANAPSTFDHATGEAVTISTNNAQMQMRKICAHPFFVAEPMLAPGVFTDSRIVSCCGKMVVLDKMLRRLRRDGHKVLIFSQFVTVLEILADYFEFVGPKVLGQYRILHGGIDADVRDSSIREFNNDSDNGIFAFLLATRAGGLGINLAAADTVIFFDSDWNPKSDAQAMDRAHRIGQVRPVVVYRLVTEGASVERRIIKSADAKGSLAKIVLQDGKAKMESALQHAMRARSGPVASSPVVSLVDGEDATVADGEADADIAHDRSQIGVARESLLRYWLRAGLSDHIIRGGIKDDELDAILDRARALQAGQRVAEVVESVVVRDCLTDTKAASIDAASSPVPADGAATSAPPGASAGKRRRDSLTATPTRSVTRNAGTPSSHSRKQARETPSALHHHAVPASAHASAKVVAAVETEMTKWEQFAAAAPLTPSKGAGYEFVYHETSRGLLAM